MVVSIKNTKEKVKARKITAKKKIAAKPKAGVLGKHKPQRRFKERPMEGPKVPLPKPKPPKYYEAVGRRKTAVARVRMWTKGEKEFIVNEKSLVQYFPTLELQQIAMSSLEKMKCKDKFRVVAKVRGGGLSAQAEAIRHGTARALVLFNPDFRKRLRRVGYLTRDPRMRERKKFGLKRARRAPQWQKR